MMYKHMIKGDDYRTKKIVSVERTEQWTPEVISLVQKLLNLK